MFRDGCAQREHMSLTMESTEREGQVTYGTLLHTHKALRFTFTNINSGWTNAYHTIKDPPTINTHTKTHIGPTQKQTQSLSTVLVSVWDQRPQPARLIWLSNKKNKLFTVHTLCWPLRKATPRSSPLFIYSVPVLTFLRRSSGRDRNKSQRGGGVWGGRE